MIAAALSDERQADQVSIAGTLIGVYPNAALEVTQLHVARSVGQAVREFYVTCANTIVPSGLQLGESVSLDCEAHIFGGTLTSDGAFSIATTYIATAVAAGA